MATVAAARPLSQQAGSALPFSMLAVLMTVHCCLAYQGANLPINAPRVVKAQSYREVQAAHRGDLVLETSGDFAYLTHKTTSM